MSADNQVRSFRIYRPDPRSEARLVQYGYSKQTAGGTQRFSVLREWPAPNLLEAEKLQERMKLDVLLDPQLRVTEETPVMEQPNHRRRSLNNAAEDTRFLLSRAVKGLTDPLPSIEESSRQIEVLVPLPTRGGRQFYVYLNDAMYQRLIAMAAAGNCTRNRLIEALLLAAEDFDFGPDTNSG